LPTFSLRPKKTVHRIAALLGYQDIVMGNHPEFTRNYLLRGPDVTAIRGLFYEGLVAFYDAHPGLSTEGRGDLLLYYRSARRVEPEALLEFLREGSKIVALFQ